MTRRQDNRNHLALAPSGPNGDAVTERERVAHLLRQTANAIAAPQQVGPNRWHGYDESLTTMSVWCLLDVLTTVVQAAHLSNAELRQTCGEARDPLVIGMAF